MARNNIAYHPKLGIVYNLGPITNELCNVQPVDGSKRTTVVEKDLRPIATEVIDLEVYQNALKEMYEKEINDLTKEELIELINFQQNTFSELIKGVDEPQEEVRVCIFNSKEEINNLKKNERHGFYIEDMPSPKSSLHEYIKFAEESQSYTAHSNFVKMSNSIKKSSK